MKTLRTFLWNIIEKIAIFCLGILFKILHKDLTEEAKAGFLQFVKFGLVGVTNTVIGYVLNIGVLLLLKSYEVGWDYIAANIVSFALSVLWSFMLNSIFVFKEEEGEKRNPWKTLLKTYIAYGFTGIVLNNVLSFIWINVFGISKYIAPLINLIISIPVNFFMNKLWAFKGE